MLINRDRPQYSPTKGTCRASLSAAATLFAKSRGMSTFHTPDLLWPERRLFVEAQGLQG